MSTEFICLATFTAKENQSEKLKEILTSLVTETRKEPGCVKYTLNQGTEIKTSSLSLNIIKMKLHLIIIATNLIFFT